MSSALPGFFKLSLSERLSKLRSMFHLTDVEETTLTKPEEALDFDTANSMVENVIGRHVIPVGVATNFIVDGKEIIVPFATEEPSVIAGASNAAKLCRPNGGFTTASGNNVCTGQIIFIPPSSSEDHLSAINSIVDEMIQVANESMPAMAERTGGTSGIDIRSVETESGLMIICDIHIKVGDSMGANCVTQACESLQKFVHNRLGFEPLMGILTNLAQKRIVYATAKWRLKDIGQDQYDGFDVANRIIMATNLAKADKMRAATHRKGIMNGVSAVVLATGNDTRAVEAAAHSYALIEGNNPALTQYRIDDDENLVGEIWIPVPVGTVGGSINRNKSVVTFRKLMKVETANDLAKVIAAVGLAQNFAALRALVTKGISAGHMKLHSRNIASEAGAQPQEVDIVAAKLVHSGKISVAHARDILKQLHCNMT